MPANVLEKNSRQIDRHKKRYVFRTLTGNSEVCALQKSTRCRAEVTATLNVGASGPGPL